MLGFGRRWTRLRSDLLIEPLCALVVVLLVDHGVARLQINVEKPTVHILASVQDRQLLGLFGRGGVLLRQVLRSLLVVAHYPILHLIQLILILVSNGRDRLKKDGQLVE